MILLFCTCQGFMEEARLYYDFCGPSAGSAFTDPSSLKMGFLGGSDCKSVCLQWGRPGFNPCVRKIPCRRKWQSTPVLLPGKSHGQRSLVGYSPWGREESDATEQLHFHFSLLCMGEGNGSPLQCSCLENPRDRGSWWAAIYGVAQSRTQLKQLSSSSSLIIWMICHY